MELHVPGAELVQCPHCDVRFVTQGLLDAHTGLYHAGMGPANGACDGVEGKDKGKSKGKEGGKVKAKGPGKEKEVEVPLAVGSDSCSGASSDGIEFLDDVPVPASAAAVDPLAKGPPASAPALLVPSRMEQV